MGLITGGGAGGGLIAENYFNTSLLTIHTECVSVEDKFRFTGLEA